MKYINLVILFLIFTCTQVRAIDQTHVVIPFAPGGASDIVGRTIAKNFEDSKYRIINLPGGKGIIAIQHTISNPSIMVASLVQYYVSNPLTIPVLPYNVETDLELIAIVGVVPHILICNSDNVRAKNFKEFASITKSLNIGVGGAQEHIATEILINKLPVKHWPIFYSQGGAGYITALIGGEIDCSFGLYPTIKNYLPNPKLVAIVSTHPVNFDVESWGDIFQQPFPFQGTTGLLISKNMSPNLKDNILADLSLLFKQSSFKEQLMILGFIPNLSVNQRDIALTIKQQQEVKTFLIKHKIKLQ
jgi:hypothetical protein